MGIPSGSARLLLEERKRGRLQGSVLQLGRSTLYFTRPELEEWSRAHGVPLAAGGAAGEALSHNPELARQGCMGDEPFFRLLGFDEVRSCDLSEWEGADYIFDLNAEVPEELRGRFDCVFETGTILQIFDLPRVLENLHELLAVGGRVIHCAVPSNNHMDLGFSMLCPTLFADYYAANGYELETHYLCEYFGYWYRGRLFTDAWRVYDYTPGALDSLSFGRYGAHQAASFVVARKVDGSTGHRRPQLGQYRRSWRDFESARGGEAGSVAGDRAVDGRRPSLFDRLDRLLGPAIGRRVKRLGERLRRRTRRPMPPLVARY